MKIIITCPEAFAMTQNLEIGLILYDDQKEETLNLFTGEEYLTVKRTSLTIPLESDLELELLHNEELRELAYENHKILIMHPDTMDEYIKYALSYN
jgi:hypothetical protein